MSRPRKNIIGQRFGRWTVIAELEYPCHLAECECGVRKKVYTGNLTGGYSTQCSDCGIHRGHHYHHPVEYSAWRTARDNHGLCPRWRDFESFLSDLGPKPVGMRVLAVDPGKVASPKTARWAMKYESTNGERYLVNGKMLLVREIIALLGISRQRCYQRIHKLGSNAFPPAYVKARLAVLASTVTITTEKAK